MMRFLYIVVLLFSLDGLAYSQTKFQPKKWYSHVSLGYGFTNYTGLTEKRAQFAGYTPSVIHLPLGGDIFSYYEPVDQQTLFGGILHTTVDYYRAYGKWTTIEQYMPAASYLYFIEERIGKGFFFRMDLGPGILRSANNHTSSNRLGWGFLMGGGLASEINDRSFLLLVNYSFLRVQKEYQGVFLAGIGLLL